MRQRNLFLEEPGFVVIANFLAGWLSTVAARWKAIPEPFHWTWMALLVLVALTAINVASAWRFGGRWTRGFWRLLVFYEVFAVGAALWWWAQGR